MGLFSRLKTTTVPILVIVHAGRSQKPKEIRLLKSEESLEKVKKECEKKYKVKLPYHKGFDNGATGIHWDFIEME